MAYNYPPPRGAPPSGAGYGQPPPGGPAQSGGGMTFRDGQQQQQPRYGGYGLPASGTANRSLPPQPPYGNYAGAAGAAGAQPSPQTRLGPPTQQGPPLQSPSQQQQQQQRQAAPPGPFGARSSFTVGGGPAAPNGVINRHGGPPPPTSGPPAAGTTGQQQHQPVGGPSGRGAQFYAVGTGGVASRPSPMQAGPPTGMEPPPTAVQSLASQMGQVSIGSSPNGVGPPGASRMPSRTAAAGGYPPSTPPMMAAVPPTQLTMPSGLQQPPGGTGIRYPPGQGGAPRGGGGYGGQAPPGVRTGAVATPGNQVLLPSIVETDMSIQADPRVMRMTVGAMPASASAHAQSKLPLGLVIQAMALDSDFKDGGLKVVNFGAQGIIRCKRCRTYMNPYVSWLSNGRQWRCNVCGFVNDVPPTYVCHLDQDGYRQDKAQRPELSQASVELVAPSEYMVRPPQPPVFMFVIDVSAPAVVSGMLHVAAETIKTCLDLLPGEERTMVGFCTFDSNVHYYNLKAGLSQPQMLVVPDHADPLVPVPDDLLVNLSESRAVVDALVESLAQMHSTTRDTECCLGPALTAAGRVMGHVGGKLVVMCASLPSTGEARLKHRENPRLLGTDREHLLLKADNPWFQNKAVEFSKMQICVDLFLFSAQYTDVATLVNLPKFTAGQLFYYPAFNAQREGAKFSAELTRVLTRATAFEAVMRVRATRGLRITNFYGNYFIRGTDLLALPNCTPDSVFAVEFGYDEQLLTASVISVQAALLYTTSSGERRIRVHNVAIPVETVIQNVFDSVNIDVVCNILAKQALEVALKTGLDNARSRIQQACVDIIRASRGGGYGSSPYMAPGGQQQQQPSAISEALQLLPLYSMALQKNVAFRGGVDVHTDERANVHSQLANMPVDHSRCFTYPRMFSLHDMDEDVGLPLREEQGSDLIPTAGKSAIRLPEVANLSMERLSPEAVFLLENGIELFLWVGREATPTILTALFGLSSLEGVDMSSLQLQTTEEGNEMCGRVNNVVAALRQERMTYLQVIVVEDSDGYKDRRFYWHLVEDGASFTGGAMNYAEYMQHVNRQSVGGMAM